MCVEKRELAGAPKTFFENELGNGLPPPPSYFFSFFTPCYERSLCAPLCFCCTCVSGE